METAISGTQNRRNGCNIAAPANFILRFVSGVGRLQDYKIGHG